MIIKINKLTHSQEELFFDKHPSLIYLKVFGSLSHVHIGPYMRNNLDPRSIMNNLVGYDDHSKVYKIYLFSTKRIIILKVYHL